MKRVKKVYFIGPMANLAQKESTERIFNMMIQELREYADSFVGNHFYFEHWKRDEEARKWRFDQLMEAEVIIQMDGCLKCPEARKDLQLAEWTGKKILFSDQANEIKEEKDSRSWMDVLIGSWIPSLDRKLKPLMTNPMKIQNN